MANGPIRLLLARMLSSSRFKEALWSKWYRYVEKTVGDQPIWFMNYGFLGPDGPLVELQPEDEPDRASIQLYEVVTRPADLAGRDVLEVSCGRGGGARYLKTYRRPRSVTCLDRTEQAVRFCADQHGALGIRFLCGDATLLPFRDEVFDIVVNVEASHCYPDFPRFLAQVRRILRPNGCLLLADMRKDASIGSWREEIAGSGLVQVEEEEITEHVVRALQASSDRVSTLIHESAPRLTRRFFGHFAATKGTAVYNRLKARDVRYVRFVLRKA